MPVSSDGGEFPWLDWATVRHAVDLNWDPLNNPHHLIAGATGSGKSHLIRFGILEPLCAMDRVLIVDTKGDDPLISKIGKEVRDLPRITWYQGMQHRDKPYQNWYRLLADDTTPVKLANGRWTTRSGIIVDRTIRRCVKEGNWVIVLDEGVEVVANGPPNMGLADTVAYGVRKGRSRRVPFIFATQMIVGIPRTIVDQSSFVWIGRIRDEERHKRLVQIGGLARQDLPYVKALQRREWLIAADSLDLYARTMVA